jgi:DNA-binding transcriptional regulator/RsmH inhibitor MraZ
LKKKEIFLQLQFYQKVKIYSLIQKEEFLYQKNYLKHAMIKTNILFVGLGKTFQIWEPKILKNLKLLQEKKLIKIDLI